MKRILLFASIALVALVSSCKKDDKPEDPKPEELIVGKWKATRFFVGPTDVLIPTSTSKDEREVEFTQSGTIAFYRKYTDLTTNPAGVTESTLNGIYTWNAGELTITVYSGTDSRTVTGTIVITESHLLFTATSGDTIDFLALLEADKL